jgi:hypothetical protein
MEEWKNGWMECWNVGMLECPEAENKND